MTMRAQEFHSRVSPKGQITLPSEIRKELGIKPKDQVSIQVRDGVITVVPRESRLPRHYQIAGALEKSLTWQEIEEIAHEEHAAQVAREGLG